MKKDSYIDQCILGMGPNISAMDGGQRQVFASTVELMRCLERQLGDNNRGLLCPDDVGMIRATQQTEVAVFTLTEGETESSLVLPALGLEYCLTLGLAGGNFGGPYTIFIQRSGTIVAQLSDATFEPDTANARAAACINICVGAIQPVTLTMRPTAAFPAGATFNIQVYRDFDCATGQAGARMAGCRTGC